MTAKLFGPDPRLDDRTTAELLEMVDDPARAVSVRGRALGALARRAREPAEIEAVVSRIGKLRDQRIMGNVSVAHLGVGGLLASQNEVAGDAARALIARWDQPDKSDLLWLLKDAGLA